MQPWEGGRQAATSVSGLAASLAQQYRLCAVQPELGGTAVTSPFAPALGLRPSASCSKLCGLARLRPLSRAASFLSRAALGHLAYRICGCRAEAGLRRAGWNRRRFELACCCSSACRYGHGRSPRNPPPSPPSEMHQTVSRGRTSPRSVRPESAGPSPLGHLTR
jgi:hypothetical protein